MNAKRLGRVAAALSCVGMMVPTVASAAVTEHAAVLNRISTEDVELQPGGMLVGQVLDAQGVAVVGALVTVHAAGVEIARTKTTQDGQFAVTGLKGGVHQVVANGQQSICRLWATRTAPPAARRGVMLVSRSDVIRGQCDCGSPVCGSGCGACDVYGRGCGGGGIGGWLANHPMVTAGAIATAIAVPLAVTDDDDPPATP